MLMMLMTMMKYFNKMYVYRRMVHTLYSAIDSMYNTRMNVLQFSYDLSLFLFILFLLLPSSWVNFYLSIQLYWIHSFWSRFSNWNEYILFCALQSYVTRLIHEWTISQSHEFNDDSHSMQRKRRTKAIPMQSL